MTSKKFLSMKKTTQQTISISPALKEWVKRYVNVNHRKVPNDERFKSISSFYTYIMGNMMELFEKGKTVDDFERVEDKDVKDFFDKFTFKATIPLYEMVIESNRFTHFSFDFVSRFLLSYLGLVWNEFNMTSYKDLESFFEKAKSRYGTTNVSKDMRLEIIPDKNKGPARAILEFIGKYKNLHFENIKFMAAIFGILGARVTDFIYSPDDYYSRLDFLETDLLFRKDLAKKERINLIRENVEYIINYNRMLDEDDKYLWMRLADDRETIVFFKNQNSFNKWIKEIEHHLLKFGEMENFLLKVLQFFKRLHWIRIENKKDLSFQFDQVIENYTNQKHYLITYLSKHSKVSESGGIFYLK